MTQTERTEWGWLRMGVVLTLALVGCAQLPAEEQPLVQGTQAQEQDMGPDVGPHELTEPQMADVMLAVNEWVVATSQLALQQATNAEVRAFAQKMVDEHTAAQQRLDALFQQLGITPEANLLSLLMRKVTGKTVEFLGRRQGADFDLAYMDAQVAMHARIVALADLILGPQAQRPELAEAIRTGRSMEQAHLMEGVGIQGRLVPAP